MATLEHALELVSELSREEQNEVEEILRKRRIEARREEIVANAREAIVEDDAGLLRSETASELIQRLRSLTESANAID
ncbi:MAG: hypothetical protein H9535_12645 [Ignavibacteria bacterium]|nr:hypothetical protein [Ignavibacteria bacterium]